MVSGEVVNSRVVGPSTPPLLAIHHALLTPGGILASHVNDPAIGVEDALMHCLRQGRMREHRMHQLLLRGLEKFIAITKPWISSVTSGPTIWAPRSSPLPASKMVLIIPWSSPSAIALPLPTKGKRPTLTLRPSALALASVDPTEAICGWQSVQPRDLRLVERMDRETLDGLDADHALMLGLVGEHRRAGDIADGINSDIGAARSHPP